MNREFNHMLNHVLIHMLNLELKFKGNSELTSPLSDLGELPPSPSGDDPTPHQPWDKQTQMTPGTGELVLPLTGELSTPYHSHFHTWESWPNPSSYD